MNKLIRFFSGAFENPVTKVLLTSHRGIYKRIDENRELLQLLQEKAPDFLEKHFWVEGWIQGQDGFLNDLIKFAPTKHKLVKEGLYPRPWPTQAKVQENYHPNNKEL